MAQRTYKTPTAFHGALKHKAQLMAAQHGIRVADIMSSYYFSRLVARVFLSEPDGWIVKGGHSLLMRYATAARLSQDVDIQRAVEGGVGEATQALLEAASLDLGDYLRFIPKRLTTHQNGADGAKQLFHVYLGNQQVDLLHVDVVVRQPPTSPPESRPIVPMVNLNWPTDWPEAKLYPIVDHLADKICALFEKHNGTPSSRYRDLADILLISQRESLDGRYAHIAVRAEARRRLIAGGELRLPPSFQMPGPAWPSNYPAAAQQVPGLNHCDSWQEAATAADAFLTPLLGPEPPGQWNPAHARWHAHTHAARLPSGRQPDQAQHPAHMTPHLPGPQHRRST